jgi:hypothetical protein
VRSHTAEGATPFVNARLTAGARESVVISLPKIVLRSINDLLKIFTSKYEERTESFNDSVMFNFLMDKELIRYYGGRVQLHGRDVDA